MSVSLAQQRVLLTGGTGFVGSAVVRALIASGAAVCTLVRAGSDQRNLDGLAVERRTGSLEDPASLRQALAGCTALFHVAADYRLWVPNPQAMYRANVDGTRELMRAAMDARVTRVVYTSSVAVLASFTDGRSADEATPVSLPDMIGHYKRSKFLAEAEVKKLAAAGLPVVIVNPSTPIGPRDIKPTPTGRVIVDAASGRIPAYVDTGLNLVHVDDVAAGHLLAYERGRIGERYILGGENMALADMLGAVAELCGRRRPTIKLPRAAIYPIAAVAETVARVTGREPFVTVDALRMSRKKMFFSSAKAERELGYRARPVREALADALTWFRAAGYCP
jgi:dihydroflavonol-4-reductase